MKKTWYHHCPSCNQMVMKKQKRAKIESRDSIQLIHYDCMEDAIIIEEPYVKKEATAV